jgi:transposase
MLRPDRTVPCVYLHRTPVDLRKQQAGLAALVQEAMPESPFSGALFAFTNKRRNKLKLLYWEKNGFVLWYKALSQEQFHWPRRVDEAVVTITGEQLNWLLDGYDVWKMKPHNALQFSHVS